ncbi:hypothetical protein CXB34_28160 [Pseudomonas amygdali pv. morsprunorum]|uniref:hypothetical protein n=1 Tax=Pseudomonas amygdali TaxID=47877 RepID=UPI000CDB9EB3|nr:hypothetical protein [Pseudomonas amygdali]POP75162.1 hypothetical protein CXB34_28160 [Pseudomonas amygdali pv. morsprunorum]
MMISTSSAPQFLTSADFLSFWKARPTSLFSPSDELAKISAEAKRVSGCHWELYEANLLRAVRDKAKALSGNDQTRFMRELTKRELCIDDSNIAMVEQAERECRTEISESQM